MKFSFLSLLSAFEDFFPFDCIYRQHYNINQDFYYCKDCFFSNINYAGMGGVFYYLSASIRFVVERSTFSQITANDGGLII